MLVLPLMIKDVVLKVTVNFKNVEVKRNILNSGVKDIRYSDIVVGKNHLKAYENGNKIIADPKAITSFIRKSINYDNDDVSFVEVNTKKYKDSDFYDTYIVPIPSYKDGDNYNEINDYIYGMLINSIRFSDPEPDRIKKIDLSLSSLGFDELFNGDFYNRLERIKNNNPNPLYIRNQLINAGYTKQLEVLDFFNNLDYEISQNSDVLLIDEFNTVNDFFKDSNKINRFLNNYKSMAISNYESYMNLAALNSLVNGRNLDWPTLSEEQQKILIRKMDPERSVA